MNIEGGEELQNPEIIGDPHSIMWYGIKAGAVELLDNLENVLRSRNPDFGGIGTHGQLYNLGHAERGHEGYPEDLKLKLVKSGEGKFGETQFQLSAHQFASEIESTLSGYYETIPDDMRGHSRIDIELSGLQQISSELEERGDIQYNVTFRETPDEEFSLESASSDDWFEPIDVGSE